MTETKLALIALVVCVAYLGCENRDSGYADAEATGEMPNAPAATAGTDATEVENDPLWLEGFRDGVRHSISVRGRPSAANTTNSAETYIEGFYEGQRVIIEYTLDIRADEDGT